jgi:ribonuclease HI
MDLVVQWNCRSICSKKSDLIHIINKYKPFVISLQETWLRPNFNFKIPGFACVREDRPDCYGGVALLINTSTPFVHIPISQHNVDFNIIAVKVNNICFVSIYIPHPSSIIFNELETILTSLPKPIFIMGDLNAQHVSWGSSSSNYYGNRVLDILDNVNLCLLNNGVCTRRTPPHEGISAPDLSMCSPNLASSLSWNTLSSSYGSDHYPIIITFLNTFHKNSYRHPPRIRHKIIGNKWHLYKEAVELNITSLPVINNNNHSECATALASLLIRTADEVFPVKCDSGNRPIKVPSPPWWDEECSTAVKKRKEAERLYKSYSSFENFNSLCIIINSTRKILKKKKWEGWRKFCALISPDTPPSLVWTNMRRFRSAFKENIPSVLPLAVLEEFIDKLAPAFVPGNIINNNNSNSLESTSISSCFTLSELKGVLSYVKDSSPGRDCILYSFVVNLCNNGLNYLLKLINSVMLNGSIPPAWKSQDIIPILKPFKPSNDSSSYRPIALSSVIAKVAEHLVKNRLEWYVENKGCLSRSQFGFRKGKSTMDSLGIFITDIRSAFTHNEPLLAAFLDVTAAYDNVNLDVLKAKLIQLQVPFILTNFIVNILTERSIHVTQDPLNVLSRLVWRGLPQGSVLSPLLYNIYTHDLDSSIPSNVNILQYADDLLIYVSGHSIENLSHLLSNSLTYLKKWLDYNGLALSTSKSCAVLFSRMRLLPPFSVFYDNSKLPVNNEVKFLGLILDNKLSGISHSYYIAAKCEKILNLLRCLAGVWWGAHPFSLKLIYNALIRSILDYGTYFLEPSNLVGLKKLDCIQSKALRIITGAMKTSPINALQVECVDSPLKLRRQYLCDRFLFRALQNIHHPLFSKLKKLSKDMETSSYWSHKTPPCLLVSFNKFISFQAPTHRSSYLPIFSYSFDSLISTPVVHFISDIRKNNAGVKFNFLSILERNWPNWHHLYCDASKKSIQNQVGIGVYHYQYNIVQKIKFPPESSVYTGECFGLYKSLEYVLLMKLNKSIIFSDSKSALEALLKFPFKSNNNHPIIFDCRNLLYKCLTNNLLVEFMWIPSHCNIPGNDRADILAAQAASSGDVFPYKNYCIDLISQAAFWLRSSWEAEWNLSSRYKGSYYKKIQPVIPTKPWFSRIKLTKRATSTIIRLRLGHTCLPSHLAKIHIINTDTCTGCDSDVGDVNHIFFSCPAYDHSSFYNDLTSLNIPFPTSISVLLSMNNIHVYNFLCNFINDYNIKI